jgi:3-hydroxyisobutyrate dehydrogenase-like beta-hydroxyacid dehydrogenase
MGTAIAERLIDAGHSVSVWNRSEGKAGDLVERGATEIASVHDAWAADVCITMLADSAALAEVALGKGGLAVADSGWGKFLIDMSTVSPESSRDVARAAASNGIKYLRAPVSGNPGVVREGNLTIVASGEEADYAAMEPLLRDIGPHVYRAGTGEAARVVKLALNLIIAGTAELLAESVTLADAHGVDRGTFLEIAAASAVGSPFLSTRSVRCWPATTPRLSAPD